jgi:hypothetical protein
MCGYLLSPTIPPRANTTSRATVPALLWSKRYIVTESGPLWRAAGHHWRHLVHYYLGPCGLAVRTSGYDGRHRRDMPNLNLAQMLILVASQRPTGCPIPKALFRLLRVRGVGGTSSGILAAMSRVSTPLGGCCCVCGCAEMESLATTVRVASVAVIVVGLRVLFPTARPIKLRYSSWCLSCRGDGRRLR